MAELPTWTQPGHYGASGTGVTLAEATLGVAWNVQGDTARRIFADAAARQFGAPLPAAPNATAGSGTLSALWLGPRSWLLVAGDPSALADFEARREALNAAGGAVFDVTASRVAWTIAGRRATAVLAKGCPLDFHPGAFAVGACAQSLYGHIGMLAVRHDTTSFTLFFARSYARDAWHSLLEAAGEYGAEIRPAAPYR